MMRKIAHVSTLPETEERNQTKLLSLVSQFASIRQKQQESGNETERKELHRIAAPWLDAALDKHPNLKALETDWGCEKAYISQARNGHVSAPLSFVLPLLQHPDCIDALTNAIRSDAGLPLAPRRAPRVSREQLLEMALAIFIESPGLLRTLILAAGERYGADAEDVAAALTGGAK